VQTWPLGLPITHFVLDANNSSRAFAALKPEKGKPTIISFSLDHTRPSASLEENEKEENTISYETLAKLEQDTCTGLTSSRAALVYSSLKYFETRLVESSHTTRFE
jgi:hypothetical protein